MNIPSIILVIVLGIIQSRAEISDDQGVLVLDTENFDEAIDNNEFILVEFYAPWCGHCKNLAPEYVKAAAQLEYKDSNIKLAKVDATENPEIAKMFGVAGYPTLKFFRSGQSIAYNGGRKASDIVKWVEKKITPLTLSLNSQEEIEKFIKSNDVNIIAFFKDKDHAAIKNIMALAEDLDGYGYKFGITSTADALSDYDIEEEGVYIFKDFDDKPAKYRGKTFAYPDLKFFIHDNALPLLIEFSPRLPPRIFASINPALYLIVSSVSNDYEAQKELAAKLATEYKRKINIVLLDVDNEKNMGFCDFFLGFKKSDAPAMRLVHGMQDKYEPKSGSFSEDSVKNYINDRLGGSGVGWTTSEKLSEDWDKNPVKVLVAKNFAEVIKKTKHVFVEFYAPWCGHCKNLAPIWDELAKKLEDRDDVMIAKLDSTVNQIDSVKIPGYPSLLLFKGSEASNTPYNGERNLDGLLNFLEDHGITLDNKKDEL